MLSNEDVAELIGRKYTMPVDPELLESRILSEGDFSTLSLYLSTSSIRRQVWTTSPRVRKNATVYKA